MQSIRSGIGGLLVLIGVCLVAGCGRMDEAIEEALCRSAAQKVCDKWFTCWPTSSKVLWSTTDTCKSSLSAWCSTSESWSGCDLDNDDLRACDNGIAASSCGTLPAACTTMVTCYTSQ